MNHNSSFEFSRVPARGGVPRPDFARESEAPAMAGLNFGGIASGSDAQAEQATFDYFYSGAAAAGEFLLGPYPDELQASSVELPSADSDFSAGADGTAA